MNFGEMVSEIANGIPVVGHIKGLVHHIIGEHEEGDDAINSANRSTVVVAAAAATGGVGALPAAVAYDAATTVISGEPQGIIASAEDFIEDPSVITALGLALDVAGDVTSHTPTVKSIFFPGKRDIFIEAIKTSDLYKDDDTLPDYGSIEYTIERPTPEMIFECIRAANEGEGDEEVDMLKNDDDHDFEDAFICDDYEGDEPKCLTKDDESYVLQYKKNQQPKDSLPTNIGDQTVPIVTKDQLDDSKNNFQWEDSNEPSCSIEENLWRIPTFLYIPMPCTFNYTGVVVTNMIQQGLLHIIIRHGHKFADHIEGFEDTFMKLPERIISMIRQLQSATKETIARIITVRLEDAFENMDAYNTARTEEVLYELQMMLYEYLRNNIVLDEDNHGYLGEGCNNGLRQIVFFKVRDLSGCAQAMTVRVSSPLYHNPGCFDNDERPVRAIISCYFIPLDEYTSRLTDVLHERTVLDD